MSRASIILSKVKLQTRGRQVVVLVRLDLGGAPHRNPDGEEISVPHLHIFREGYGDKWAYLVPTDGFRAVGDVWMIFEEFLQYCNVTRPPNVVRGLFT